MSGYAYGCETLLRVAQIPRITVGSTCASSSSALITTGGDGGAGAAAAGAVAGAGAGAGASDKDAAAEEACTMLQTLLTASGRKLSPAQLAYVSQQVAVEPSALYVRLALRIVGE